jgi:outer membrane protein TolC
MNVSLRSLLFAALMLASPMACLGQINTGGATTASSLSTFKPVDAPLEPILDHQKNKTLNMSPIKLGALIQVAAMRPLRLEASYDEPISLQEALDYALKNCFPIRIAHESVVYQESQLASQLADFLPSYSMSFTYTKSHVLPNTDSTSRVFVPRISYPVFAGGNDFYSMLAQYYRMKGWQETYKSNISDALLDVYQKYTNLVLNHALLKIRLKSVDVSQLQLKLNNENYRAGSGTVFAIMQSRSQLAQDKQALLAQQVATRQSALLLGYSLNLPLAINLVPDREYLSESAIVDEKLSIDELLHLALVNRPELRQYEFFRYSAARNVQLAASNLYPTATFATSYSHSSTFVNDHTLSGNTATANNVNTGLSTTSATSTTSSVTASNANNGVTSSATSGSTTSTTNASGGNVPGAGIYNGVFSTLQNSFGLTWSLPNLGLNSVASIVGARALSRQALLQANQELLLVAEQVRSDYVTALSAREQIDNAAYGVDSSQEALRLAGLRLKSGYGTNLELITAQRDYINALYSQAQAIVASNLAQAQLLHDTGVLSTETLTSGYRRR